MGSALIRGSPGHHRIGFHDTNGLWEARVFFRYPVAPEIQGWIVANFRWAMAAGLLTGTTPLAGPGDLAEVRQGTRAALARCASLPPGGAGMAHHLTDLHGVTRGFGLSLLGETEFGGAELGGAALRGEGPLSLPTRAHAFALFLALRGIGTPDLPPRAARAVARAQARIDKDPATLMGLRGLF